jgi:NO-binding membrane sensor protein with MHYT domain
MFHAIWDYLDQIFDVGIFVALVTAALLVFAYWLVRLMTESLLLSTLFAPVMLLGGLASNHYFNMHFIVLMQDPDSNTVLGIAAGIISAMLIMLMLTRVAYAFGDRRTRARRAAPT